MLPEPPIILGPIDIKDHIPSLLIPISPTHLPIPHISFNLLLIHLPNQPQLEKVYFFASN